MSDDGQPVPLGAPTAIATSPASQSPEFQDVDLYAPSAMDVPSIATSKDSLSNTTFLNTQANAQSAQRPGIIEHQEIVKSILNNENANDVSFVRTPSPISLPSLDPGPLQLSRNGAANTDIASRRDSATGDDLSSRRDSLSRQNSDLKQESNARQDSNSTNRDPDTRRSSYSRRNSDIGRDQTSRSSDTRQNSNSRKDSDPRESMRATIGPPTRLRDEQNSMYNGSPLNPANSHEELRRSRHRSSRRLPTPPPTNNHVISANPYSGMGAYPTPQMYASPLPVPQYMIPPPVDYSHIYSPNVRPNSHLPPDATIPSAASPMYPSSRIPIIPMIPPAVPTPSSRSTRPSVSSNIVAAAATTPELKNMKSIMGSIALPDTGSFADNNPYTLRSKQSRSTPDLQRPHSIPGPMPLPPDEPPVGRASSAAFLAPYNVTQGIPNGFQPNSPWARSAASATNSPYRRERYDSRHGSRSRVDEPSQQFGGYEYFPQHQKSPADVVSAASNMPIPEKRGTQSFTETEPYGGSAVRRDTVSPVPERKATGSFAEHNPIAYLRGSQL
ncbi:hypothetical protein BJ912DRAFT_1055915 [Pholiota molesta]|nr:hypothetical protein BJ912DRAFT_1055915 [Pholiota molesta]